MNEDQNKNAKKPEDQENEKSSMDQQDKKDRSAKGKGKNKKEKENGLVKGIKKIGRGGATVMSKVSKYPKIATTVILTAGIGLGYLLKTVVEIAASSSDEENVSAPIETEFADSDSGATEESSTEE